MVVLPVPSPQAANSRERIQVAGLEGPESGAFIQRAPFQWRGARGRLLEGKQSRAGDRTRTGDVQLGKQFRVLRSNSDFSKHC
jgi:hypothetical protein